MDKAKEAMLDDSERPRVLVHDTSSGRGNYQTDYLIIRIKLG
jgi:hypothetical protein